MKSDLLTNSVIAYKDDSLFYFKKEDAIIVDNCEGVVFILALTFGLRMSLVVE